MNPHMVQDTGPTVVQDICILKIAKKVIGATIITIILNGRNTQMALVEVRNTE